MFNKQLFYQLGFIWTDIFEIFLSLLFIDFFRHTYMSPIHHMKKGRKKEKGKQARKKEKKQIKEHRQTLKERDEKNKERKR